MSGFPREFLSTLRCTADGGALQLAEDAAPTRSGAIAEGMAQCRVCGRQYAIEGGILNLLDAAALDEESRHEQRLRDLEWGADTASQPWWEDAHNGMEMSPTMEALQLDGAQTLLELGCGDGRYTVVLARSCRTLAVDFSLESLRTAARRLDGVAGRVGLVLGDVSTLKVAERAFDVVFSTLVSNLPSRQHRDALYALSRRALRPDGRFVFSAHHHGIHQRLSGEEKSGRYEEGGIYRYNLGMGECRAEVRPYFERVRVKPIQIYFPFGRRLHLPVARLSRLMEHVPLANRLGQLILCTARRPRPQATPSPGGSRARH